MSALKLSNPVIFSVGMIADNLSFHVNVIARARAPGIHWVEPMALAFFSLVSPCRPAAQAGIDCSFCANDTRLRRGPGQDRTALVV